MYFNGRENQQGESNMAEVQNIMFMYRTYLIFFLLCKRFAYLILFCLRQSEIHFY